MGTGKTTLGEALRRSAGGVASFLPAGCAFADLDHVIEAREGMSVRRIFELKGEEAFRRMEAETLRELGNRDNIIIACGGGTPCQGDNMEWMNSRGLTVLLEASEAVLLRRLLQARDQRPLLAGMTAAELGRFITAKQQERSRWYGMAQVRFPSDLLESEEEIAGSVKAFGEMLSRRGHI